MEFIQDQRRAKIITQIERRIKQKRSVLMVGDYGNGKTRLLNEMQKKHPHARRVTGLGTVTQVLGEIAGEVNVQPWKKREYITKVTRLPVLCFIDEGQHLHNQIWPYLKLFIEHGSVFVITGLPETELHIISSRNEDVWSRFLKLELEPLDQDLVMQMLNDFDTKALVDIFTNTENMRAMCELIDDCRDYAKTAGLKKISVEIAQQVREGLL